jgi:hypothetical protein
VTDDDASTPEQAVPLLRVVHGGEPTPEEVAALVAAVQLRRAAQATAAEIPVSRWASRRALLRRPLAPGPGAWAASAGRHP